MVGLALLSAAVAVVLAPPKWSEAGRSAAQEAAHSPKGQARTLVFRAASDEDNFGKKV